MIFRPLTDSAWIVAVFAVAGLALCAVGLWRTGPKGRWTAVRRVLMVAVVTAMLAGPSVPGEVRKVTSNTEVWLLIDRTGSMAAEDWTDGQPRLAGVRQDAQTVLSAMAGARFSVMTWDSEVRTVLPLTTDESAVQSFLDTFEQETSDFSQGSSPDRPVAALTARLAQAAQANPQNIRYLFVLSDGETSNTDQAFDASTWAPVAQYIDGGLVIGYGTTQGARMKTYRLGVQDQGEYIRDYSKPGAPEAVSRIDESALRGIAGRLGVDYVHSPDTQSVQGHAADMMHGAATIAESREQLSTYRYAVWPLAVALAALVAWEAAALATRARTMRSAHVI